MPQATQRSSLRGRVIGGRYELGELLTSGGMADIYRAVQRPLNRTVAVKVLHRGDDELVERFRREAEAVGRLRSAHTVTLYDFGEEPDLLFIAMELLVGETLFDAMVRARPLPLDLVLDVADHVLESLDEAHRLGIIHRDLKPENVFLVAPIEKGGPPGPRSANGILAKVLDFGLAKITSSGREGVTAAGFTVGTPGYMSPEQLVGGTVDGRADLFSLATVLFQALTGDMPYDGYAALRGEAPRPCPAHIPGGVAKALLRSLAADPSRRFPDAHEMAQAMRATREATVGHQPRLAAPALAPEAQGHRPVVRNEPTIRSQPRVLVAFAVEPDSSLPPLVPAVERAVRAERGSVDRLGGPFALASFETTQRAMSFAFGLVHRAVAARQGATRTPRVKIAVHMGYLVVRGGIVGGDSVEMLGRVMDLANAHGVYVTRGVYEEVKEFMGLAGERAGRCPSEIGDPTDVYCLAVHAAPSAATPARTPADRALRLDTAEAQRPPFSVAATALPQPVARSAAPGKPLERRRGGAVAALLVFVLAAALGAGVAYARHRDLLPAWLGNQIDAMSKHLGGDPKP